MPAIIMTINCGISEDQKVHIWGCKNAGYIGLGGVKTEEIQNIRVL